MYIANVFQSRTQHLAPAFIGTSPLFQRLAGWIGGIRRATNEQSIRDAATELYARAARYESSQPGFAADLRAAADSVARNAAALAR